MAVAAAAKVAAADPGRGFVDRFFERAQHLLIFLSFLDYFRKFLHIGESSGEVSSWINDAGKKWVAVVGLKMFGSL